MQNLWHTFRQRTQLNPIVFLGSALMIGGFGIVDVINPDYVQQWLDWAQKVVTNTFGWWYILLMAAAVLYVFWLAFSSHGNIVLGKDGETPGFGFVSWVSMLFSSGIGIALLYYGVYEPLDHFINPPDITGSTINASREAMVLTFLHWGIHGWSLYALTGIAIGYFAYRKGMPLALRTALYPIFGDRIYGIVGHIVDGFGILATTTSLVTNIGIGALLIHAGLHYLFGLSDSPQVLIALVLSMMLVGTLTAIAGIEKGVSLLCSINVRILCLLLFFVLLAGPTTYLVNGLLGNIGDYLSQFIGKTFSMYTNVSNGNQWLSHWTLFYWAWWIAWAPFVGMFVARISRGRTIREVVFGVMLIPLGFTLAWLSFFGNTAIDLVLNHGQHMLVQVAGSNAPMTLFTFLESLPFTNWIAAIVIISGFVLFLCPVDSGILMISALCTQQTDSDDSHEDAPVPIRIFWSVIVTIISIGLLLAGKFDAMVTAVVLCGLPFSIILMLYMIGLAKELKKEGKKEKPALQAGHSYIVDKE